MKMFPHRLAAVIGLSIISSIAGATPLRMEYQLTDLGGSSYQYDFSLKLDNNDGSWVSGQEWDWIIFGSNDSAGSYNSFDTNGGALGGLNWMTSSFAAPISMISSSSGSFNGPTLIMYGSALTPGWIPTAIGQSLTWSGTSSVYIPDGAMQWAALVTDGGAAPVYSARAQLVATSVPEPGTLMLFGLGLLGLGAVPRKAARLIRTSGSPIGPADGSC